MDIRAATRDYETWLGGKITLIDADLARKHAAMAEAPFPFLRATFYRWMQLWPTACPECLDAPEVLGVGDLHVENFGTWRDIEGRLTWGINDFDEACAIPYALDLVRLSASAHMAIEASHLSIEKRDACDAILAGYLEGLTTGGRTFVLAEHHPWLRSMVSGVLRDPEHFWARFSDLPDVRPPSGALRAIDRIMPTAGLECRYVHRVAGLGSLGRERYVAIAEFRGGKVAREAKALAPSACAWAVTGKVEPDRRLYYQRIMDRAVRAVDPFVRLKGRWIVRRLAPDCSRVELTAIPKERDESRLLHAMGFETANIHLGTKKAAKAIGRDLKKRPHHWLHRASEQMVQATVNDWKQWRGHSKAAS